MQHLLISHPLSDYARSNSRDLHWLPINQRVIYKLSVLTYKALHTGHPCYLQTYLISIDHLELCDPLTLTFLLFLPVLGLLLHLELFVYLRLIAGTLFLWISAHLIVLLLSSPVLNLTFLLLPITSSHSHASASDSTFDYNWRYISFSLTLTLTLQTTIIPNATLFWL